MSKLLLYNSLVPLILIVLIIVFGLRRIKRDRQRYDRFCEFRQKNFKKWIDDHWREMHREKVRMENQKEQLRTERSELDKMRADLELEKKNIADERKEQN